MAEGRQEAAAASYASFVEMCLDAPFSLLVDAEAAPAAQAANPRSPSSRSPTPPPTPPRRPRQKRPADVPSPRTPSRRRVPSPHTPPLGCVRSPHPPQYPPPQHLLPGPERQEAQEAEAAAAPRLSRQEEYLIAMQAERVLAESFGLTWRERGPPGGPTPEMPTWRGQHWREGSGRWANRGGRNRDWYRAYYAGAHSTKGKDGNGKGHGGKGKGKASGGGSSSSMA